MEETPGTYGTDIEKISGTLVATTSCSGGARCRSGSANWRGSHGHARTVGSTPCTGRRSAAGAKDDVATSHQAAIAAAAAADRVVRTAMLSPSANGPPWATWKARCGSE